MEWEIVLTCEHASNAVPQEWKHLFEGCEQLLASHRGYDPGIHEIAKYFERELHVSLHEGHTSRLLVELNRSLSSPNLFSRQTKTLPFIQRQKILKDYYFPYRQGVEKVMEEIITKKKRILHLSIHSFTPVLYDQERNAEVTFLYNSKRKREAIFCTEWQHALEKAAPEYRSRRNYPYLGKSDCFCEALRKKYDGDHYIGVELEINNKLLVNTDFKSEKQHLLPSILSSFKEAYSHLN